MKTFAKIGRDALMRLFAERKIFDKTRYEELGMINTLPRQVFVSKEPIDLEKKFLSHMVGVLGREDNYKIFLWNVEMGLAEIVLISNEKEGKLLDLIFDVINKPVNLSHIVIVEKKDWIDNDKQFVQEKVVIYSLTSKQRMEIFGHLSWIDHLGF